MEEAEKLQLEGLVLAKDESVAHQLAASLSSGDNVERAWAAKLLGSMGKVEWCSRLALALRDPDMEVVRGAVMGISQTPSVGSGLEFLTLLFLPLSEVLTRVPDHFSTIQTVAALLLRIDGSKAEAILTDPALLCPSSDSFQEVLLALEEAEIPLTLDQMEFLAEGIAPKCGEMPWPRFYCRFLLTLADAGKPDAELLLREAIHRFPERSEYFAEAILDLHGMDETEIYFDLIDRVEGSGIESLSEPQQNFYSVKVMHHEWNNGGLSQYFGNSSGDHFRYALRGLIAMGAKASADRFQSALMLFGEEGPSEDWNQRENQLALLGEDIDAALMGIVFLGSQLPLRTLCLQYLMDHASEFTEG